jgi:hypothetical protein
MQQKPATGSLDLDSPSVQSHLTMLQGVIGRLASNSASCKTWCVSLVSALAVVAAGQGTQDRPKILLVAALPIILFGILDAYYLGLERRFRKCYETFVTKLHYGTASVEDAFLIAPQLKFRGLFLEAWQALFSFSVWPFYGGLAVILWLLKIRLWG